MLATAETVQTGIDFVLWGQQFAQGEQVLLEPEQPLVREVPQLELETLARTRAAELMGRVATGAVCEVQGGLPAENMSLMKAIHRAREGDPAARKLVETDVLTDVIERSIKAGHVMRVEQEVDAEGRVLQHGQTAEFIQENSLRFASGTPQILERTKPEVRNMFRIEELNRRGLLEDYVFVVFSRAADNMSLQEMEDAGFFVDTMSMAIQATTLSGAGKLTTESAFVAGKRNRESSRHDAETLACLGDTMNVDFRGKTAAQGIDMPVLIRKDLMPNGVVDVVYWWDAAAGGTFFGQDKPQQDYLEYLQQCREREAELQPTVQQIVEQLISQAGTITTPLEAIQRLHKLSEVSLLHRALTDEKIDGMVFGAEAAFFLMGARHHMEQGNTVAAEQLLSEAIEVARSGSCPTAGANGRTSAIDDNGGERGEQSDDADCVFTSKECPQCRKKNVVTWDRKLTGNHRRISGSCGCFKDYVK